MVQRHGGFVDGEARGGIGFLEGNLRGGMYGTAKREDVIGVLNTFFRCSTVYCNSTKAETAVYMPHREVLEDAVLRISSELNETSVPPNIPNPFH